MLSGITNAANLPKILVLASCALPVLAALSLCPPFPLRLPSSFLSTSKELSQQLQTEG